MEIMNANTKEISSLSNYAKLRVLIGSPIHQDYDILNEFLKSLEGLIKDNIDVAYCFVDDNINVESKELLLDFQKNNRGVTILNSEIGSAQYKRDEYTHRWSNKLVERVATFKNTIIEYAKENKYDFLFFIDSDIVLHPKTLKQLIYSNKDIISNIFWTKWNPNTEELPQVWLKDAYTLYDSDASVTITNGDAQKKTKEFITMLKKPGTYRVGGLGACTLISQKALMGGCNFNKIYNLSFWGEDRAFCVRAVALGFELFVDTYYPAYHIYRREDLKGVEKFKVDCNKRDLEILCNNIFEIITNGVESLETYSYNEEFKDDWKKYFTESAIATQSLRILDRGNIKEIKLINRCRVKECNFSLNINGDKMSVKGSLVYNGYKNEYSFYKEVECTITVMVQDDGMWIIDNFEIIDERKITTPYFIRRVTENPKLTLSMIVKNEENRYLERALLKHREYIDSAVIIDDGSDDKTIQIVKDILGDKNLTLIENKISLFNNEINLRRQQWNETIKINPDWMLILDADEIFEDAFSNEVRKLIENIDVDSYLFRLFDFWDEENYRDDSLWHAHNTYRCFLTRYQSNYLYRWRETAQHCGRMPANCMELSYALSNLRLKHFGWARLEDRLNKYQRYMQLDPNGEFGSMDQYKSILDPRPKLVRWNENE